MSFADKYYIVDILNKTNVTVEYKNFVSSKEHKLLPNDTDHPLSDYIRSSDYFTDGDLIPLSTSPDLNRSIRIRVDKQGLPDLIIYRPDSSIQLAQAMDGGTWANVSGQNLSSGISDGKRLIMVVEVVGTDCQIQFWPDKALQPSGGYVTTKVWPGVLAQIGRVVEHIKPTV
ncbi:hypothetical protein AX17_007359 [Amanita inopinata Kibby_2008]|nr:hypothetical protein AX17_007359 [Amanita inopinata Kibby_2008]